jgi:8-oxo-dGTP diphosphatase
MRGQKEKVRPPILAAGGIVMRAGPEPLVAIVQLRKCNSWVLPKGKLNADEGALAAARREVLEEVRHKVHIHEFLGTISYDVGDRAKVVKFWRMRAIGEPVRGSSRDVKAVQWLPLDEAVAKLTRSREQAFLESVAPVVAKAVQRAARKSRPAESPGRNGPAEPAAQAAGKPIQGAARLSTTDGTEPHEQSPRDHIVETVRAWFRRHRRRQAA